MKSLKSLYRYTVKQRGNMRYGEFELKDEFRLQLHSFEEIRQEFLHEMHGMHKHDYYLMGLCTEGSCDYSVDFEEFHLTKNSMFFLAPGQFHAFTLSNHFNGFIITFGPRFFETIEQHFSQYLRFSFFHHTHMLNLRSDAETTYYANLIAQIRKEAQREDGSAFHAAKVYHMFAFLLYEICDAYPAGADLHAKSSVEMLNLFVNFALLVDTKCTTIHTVNQYLQMLQVSSYKLAESVRLHANQSPLDFILEKIVFEAKKHLRFTDLSVKEIAQSLGYSEQSNFSQMFKRRVGCSPAEFREQGVMQE